MSALALAQPNLLAPFTRVALAGALVLAGAGILADSMPGHAVLGVASKSGAELRSDAADATNAQRAGHCPALRPSDRLHKAAQRHADDMAKRGYFSHTSADGRSWDARQRAAGVRSPGGENIAYGYDSGASVVAGWMDSPGHRRNIMDCGFRKAGYGYNAAGGYWVQTFSR